VIANKDAYSICSINLSLGDSVRNTQHCPGSVYEAAFASARAAGIVPVVASGNEYMTDALSGPACAPSALSVGAVHDSNHGSFDCDTSTAADKVACFSNVAAFLDIVAPGSSITAGGWTMSGTSMAAPHVAAAAAVLKAAKPSASADQVVAAMKLTGGLVASAAGQMPRLNLDAAFCAITGLTATPAPTAALAINGGAPSTPSPRVTLSVTMPVGDGAGMTMCVSNTAECASMQPFSPKIKWELADVAVNGAKTVNVWLQDGLGNKMTAPATATINFALGADTAAPTDASSLMATPDAASGASVALKWDPSAATDDVTGVSHFIVAYRAGGAPPVKCAAKRGVLFATVPKGDDVSGATVSGLKPNRKYRFRVCTVDYAGNSSSGLSASATTRKRRASTRRLLA
jgi:hypothetical protein